MKRGLQTLIVLAALATGSAAQAPATIRLEPSTQRVRMGTVLDLDVWVDNPSMAPMFSYRAEFSFAAEPLTILQAPHRLRNSILRRLFHFAAPPPFGGFHHCTQAIDGKGQDYLLAIGFSPNFSSGSPYATGHLFRTSFLVGQARRSGAIPFRWNEFSATCTLNETYLHPASTTPFQLQLQDTRVFVLPNLSAQGRYRPGGHITFELMGRKNLPYVLFSSLATTKVQLGAAGVMYIDNTHPSFSVLKKGRVSASGSVFHSELIPPFSKLKGRSLYVQAATGKGGKLRLSNPIEIAVR